MSSRNKKSWKTYMVTMTAVLSMSLLAACGDKTAGSQEPAEDDSKVIVKYTGGEFTEKEFQLEQNVMQFMSPEYAQFMQMDEFKQYLARQGVAYEYLSENAGEEAKKAAKTQADELVKKNKTMMGAEQFTKALEAQNLTEQDLKDYMQRVMTVMEDQKNKVTDDEIKKDFEDHKQDFTTASVRHVLIRFVDSEGKERKKEDALKLAKEVKAKLDGGEDFAKVAKEYSEDPGSKDNGGLYEKTEVGGWADEFKQKALSLPINEISEPVETVHGYHVMKVEKREETTYDKITDERKDAIRSELASAKVDEFMKTDLDKLIEKMDLPKSESPAEPSTDSGEEAPKAEDTKDTTGK
ncbi:peptidylprolyl isomerase [Paenibacillus lemnae]|uniref:Peptidylprolyl isomerase n=1 Tax=Paenibacillus lemnae TaxID=1330551 RepID=A0A848M9L3_PAELE|nr:peptidylprolyl isomerase [Paenibacillus lemnae]NMO97747.1 peptidylprolyl isomerase [Paenibacillus lemnae]